MHLNLLRLSFHHIRLGGILAVLYNNKEEKIMSKKNDIPTFPIAGWKIGPLPGYDALALKFQFLSSPMQSINEAQETQFFIINPQMARTLIADLTKHIDTVEKSAIQSPQGDTH
ncbi:bssS family protein [Arsenophonus nasoniae]|uniref:BssS family protein n=2 Tax=Arsenophonus nasoniae TaxID=638 RepID=A0ABY8NMT5_9GAMM|nr:bssS family protein [Arsenophonus nasoniae]WGM04520.1 bssS family protein [Arsenophonus nasoniae]WGM09628.1 bssS family protein [Arsenophonus nasoniae]WGM14348.1 bssS family protein [Arsenophonus nasoniae]